MPDQNKTRSITFDTTKQTISYHLSNIYNDLELEKTATVKEILTVQSEGDRSVERITANYNNLLNERMRFKASEAASCNKPMPGKDQSASLLDGTVEVELPATITRSLRAIARDAEYELANCNALKDIISPVIEVVGYRDE